MMYYCPACPHNVLSHDAAGCDRCSCKRDPRKEGAFRTGTVMIATPGEQRRNRRVIALNVCTGLGGFFMILGMLLCLFNGLNDQSVILALAVVCWVGAALLRGPVTDADVRRKGAAV